MPMAAKWSYDLMYTVIHICIYMEVEPNRQIAVEISLSEHKVITNIYIHTYDMQICEQKLVQPEAQKWIKISERKPVER